MSECVKHLGAPHGRRSAKQVAPIFRLLEWALDADLGSVNEKAVLFALIKYADRKHTCYPSQDTLAEKLSLSRGTVNKALASLQKRSVIARQARRANGRRLPDLILLKPPFSPS